MTAAQTIALAPTRRSIDPTKPFDGQPVLDTATIVVVTQNDAGRVRALAFVGPLGDLLLDDSFDAVHATRSTRFGLLTVLGIVSRDGLTVGLVPAGRLPLRFGSVVPIATA